MDVKAVHDAYDKCLGILRSVRDLYHNLKGGRPDRAWHNLCFLRDRCRSSEDENVISAIRVQNGVDYMFEDVGLVSSNAFAWCFDFADYVVESFDCECRDNPAWSRAGWANEMVRRGGKPISPPEMQRLVWTGADRAKLALKSIATPSHRKVQARLSNEREKLLHPPPITDPIQLTRAEAAKLVGVTTRTIYDWGKNGKLPCFKVGNGLVFSKSTLEILRDSRRGRPVVATPDGGNSDDAFRDNHVRGGAES